MPVLGSNTKAYLLVCQGAYGVERGRPVWMWSVPLLRDRVPGYGGSMCDTCGDIVLITEWTQMTLDDSHEMWFKVSECLCGSVMTHVEVRDTVVAGG